MLVFLGVFNWRLLWFYLSQFELTQGLGRISYWFILSLWLFFVIRKKISSERTLKIAFILTVATSFFHLFALSFFVDFLSHLTLIGWLIGIGQSLLELGYYEKNL